MIQKAITGKRRIIVAVTAIITFTYLGLAIGEANTSFTTKPEYQLFESMEAAQTEVEFELATLSTPGIEFASVTVEHMGGSMILVDARYHSPNGGLLMFTQSNAQHLPPDGETSTVEVAGTKGLTISTRNLAGTPIGAVYWTSNGVTRLIVDTNVEGSDLIQVANAVQLLE